MSLDSLASGWTATLQHPVDTRDISGGVVRSYANDAIFTNFQVGIQPLSAKEKWSNAQRLIFLTDKIYVTQDIGAKREDKLLIQESGQVFLIEGYHNVAGQNVFWMIEAREQMN